MQASGSSSSSAICGTGSPPNRHPVSSTSVPGPQAPHGTPLPPDETTGPTRSGISDAASNASSPPRDRPITHGGTSSTASCARSQSHARATTSTSMSRSASGAPGWPQYATREDRYAVSGQQGARHRPAGSADRAAEDDDAATPAVSAGQEQPADHLRLGHDVLGDVRGEDRPRVRRRDGLLVTGRPERDAHRVQDVPVVGGGDLGAPEQPERVDPAVAAVGARVLGRVDLAVPVHDVLPRARPALTAELEGRLDGDPPGRRRTGQQHPVGTVDRRTGAAGSQLHPRCPVQTWAREATAAATRSIASATGTPLSWWPSR